MFGRRKSTLTLGQYLRSMADSGDSVFSMMDAHWKKRFLEALALDSEGHPGKLVIRRENTDMTLKTPLIRFFLPARPMIPEIVLKQKLMVSGSGDCDFSDLPDEYREKGKRSLASIRLAPGRRMGRNRQEIDITMTIKLADASINTRMELINEWLDTMETEIEGTVDVAH